MSSAPIDLVAEARAIPRKPNGDPCSVVIATQTRPDLAASIVALVHDTESLPKAASAVLAKYNLTISPLAISRHRRGLPCVHCGYHGLHA